MADFGISYLFEIIDKFTNVAKRIEKATSKLEQSIEKTTQTAKKSSMGFQKYGKGLVSFGKTLGKITAPLDIFGVIGVKRFAQFDMAMRRTGVSMNVSGQQFEQLKKQAMDLGEKTKFSAMEVANAQRLLYAKINDVNKVIKITPKLTKLAFATQNDLGEMATNVGKVLFMYGDRLKSVAHATDILAQASIETKGNLGELLVGFGYAAPGAKTAGLSFDDLVAALIMANKAGEKMSIVGRSLGKMMGKLLSPNKKAREAMKLLKDQVTHTNLVFADQQGKMLPLVTIAKELAQATSKLTEKSKDQFFTAVAGSIQAKRIVEIIANQTEQFDKLTGRLKNVTGVMDRLYSQQMASLEGSFITLSSAVNYLGLQLVDWQQRPIKGAVKKLAELIAKIAHTSGWMKRLSFGMIDAAVLSSPFLIFLGKLLLLARVLGKPILPLLAVGIGALVSPVAGVVLWLPLLSAALMVAYNKFKRVRDIVNSIKQAFINLIPPLKVIMPLFSELHRKGLFKEYIGKPLARYGGIAGAKFMDWLEEKKPVAPAVSPLPLHFTSMKQQIMSKLDITVHDPSGNVKSISGESDGAMNFRLGTNMAHARAAS